MTSKQHLELLITLYERAYDLSEVALDNPHEEVAMKSRFMYLSFASGWRIFDDHGPNWHKHHEYDFLVFRPLLEVVANEYSLPTRYAVPFPLRHTIGETVQTWERNHEINNDLKSLGIPYFLTFRSRDHMPSEIVAFTETDAILASAMIAGI